MIQPRRLAAIDLAFLGPTLVIAEFAFAVVLCLGLGVYILAGATGLAGAMAGLYFLSLGLNYVPMLSHALSLWRSGGWQGEIAEDPADSRAAMARYRRQSLWLLVPLAAAIAEVTEQIGGLRRHSKR